jgi:hypothetical protein
MEKFKQEERLLDLLTHEKDYLYSYIELSTDIGLTPQDLEGKSKFKPLENQGEICYLESIFTFDDNIFIYLCRSEIVIKSFFCRIYFPIEKKNDVQFFLLNLKKMKKNGN